MQTYTVETWTRDRYPRRWTLASRSTVTAPDIDDAAAAWPDPDRTTHYPESGVVELHWDSPDDDDTDVRAVIIMPEASPMFDALTPDQQEEAD